MGKIVRMDPCGELFDDNNYLSALEIFNSMVEILCFAETLRGGSPCFFVKLDFEIAIDQQTKAHNRTF